MTNTNVPVPSTAQVEMQYTIVQDGRGYATSRAAELSFLRNLGEGKINEIRCACASIRTNRKSILSPSSACFFNLSHLALSRSGHFCNRPMRLIPICRIIDEFISRIDLDFRVTNYCFIRAFQVQISWLILAHLWARFQSISKVPRRGKSDFSLLNFNSILMQ